MLLENVKGLTFKNNRETFNLILDNIKNLGYAVSWKVLNAKDFGLPQNRERVFIVANRLGLDFEFPSPPKTPTKIGDILELEVDAKYYLSQESWQNMLARK
jgi:DNA (cytosine-5)-methyltransferase 1